MKDTNPRTSFDLKCVALAALGLLIASVPAQAQTFYGKANNTDALNLSTSWTNNNGSVPGTVDTALWDSTVTGANTVALGDSYQYWGLLKIANPGGLVTIQDSGNTLNLYGISGVGIDMSAATVDLTLNCGLNLAAAVNWNLAAARMLTLGGAVTGANPKQSLGTVLLGPGGSLAATMTYGFSGNSKLDLGGTSQSILSLGPASAATSTVTNGSVALSLATGDFNPLPQGDGSILDMSGLSSFTVNNVARSFVYNMGGTAAGTISLYLAATGAGTNFLAVSALNPGSGTSASAGSLTLMYLGAANVIHANGITMAGYKISGSMLFKRGLVNPTVTIRGTDGTSRMGSLVVGNCYTGSYNETGTNDFTGGTIDCLVTNILVAQHIAGANNSIIGVLTVDGAASSVDATTITLAAKTGSGTPMVSGTINQLNGSVKVGTLILGDNQGTSAGGNIRAGYNLGNGTLRAQTIQPGKIGTNGTENAASYRAIYWTNGIIQNYDAATDLVSSNGVTLSAPGTGTRSFTVASGRKITVQGSITQVGNGASAITKDGAGTLDLRGTGDNP